MQKETEKDVISINLSGELNHFMIKDLEKCVASMTVRGKLVEQFRFIESVLKKSKQPKPRFFSAREISTMCGYFAASLQQTKKSNFALLKNTFETALSDWEKHNPEINN